MSNLSKPYGYYGGVTNENHYVPPEVASFEPHPASVPFYGDYRSKMISMLSSIDFVKEFLAVNSGSILLRTLVDEIHGIGTFDMYTLDQPEDIITYNSNLKTTVDLLEVDAGHF